MYFYMYKIINIVNGKIYVGVHKTLNVNDGYMGSGLLLKRAQEKYGIDNFKKEILEWFESQEDMFLKESEIVNEEFIKNSEVYNLTRGGFGGNRRSSEDIIRVNRDNFSKGIGISSKKSKEKLNTYRTSEKNKAHMKNILPLSKTKDAIKKKKNTLNGIRHQQGPNNSQFGTMWITDGISNKKIKKENPIPEGWKKGRIRKNNGCK